MDKYHKIQTVFLRDPANKHKTLLYGQFALPEFEYLADNQWMFTEKIDGTNVRVNWTPGAIATGVEFGGRTDRAQLPANLFKRLQELFLEEKFAALYPDTPMTLFGEGYGAKIQKGGNKYIPDGVGFILFDVRIGGNWLDRENVLDIAVHLDLDVVPVISGGTLWQAVTLCERGFNSVIAEGGHMAEGLVMRPTVELVSRTGKRIIAKVKTKDFPR